MWAVLPVLIKRTVHSKELLYGMGGGECVFSRRVRTLL